MTRRPASHHATLPLELDAWPRLHREDIEAGSFLAQVADEAGLEAARFLIARFGDLWVSVPKRERERLPEWLAEVAQLHSRRLVRTIIALRGGEQIQIPAPEPLHDLAVRREIKRLYNGTNGGDLAVRFQRSRRFVKRVALGRA